MSYFEIAEYTGIVLCFIWLIALLHFLIHEAIKIITEKNNGLVFWISLIDNEMETDTIIEIFILGIIIFIIASFLWPVTWLVSLFFILTYSIKFIYKEIKRRN